MQRGHSSVRHRNFSQSVLIRKRQSNDFRRFSNKPPRECRVLVLLFTYLKQNHHPNEQNITIIYCNKRSRLSGEQITGYGNFWLVRKIPRKFFANYIAGGRVFFSYIFIFIFAAIAYNKRIFVRKACGARRAFTFVVVVFFLLVWFESFLFRRLRARASRRRRAPHVPRHPTRATYLTFLESTRVFFSFNSQCDKHACTSSTSRFMRLLALARA